MASERSVAFVVGDSHYASIALAAQATLPQRTAGAGTDVWFFDTWKYGLTYPFTVVEGDEWVVNPDLTATMREIAGEYEAAYLFTVLGGGHHHAMTLIEGDHPFDVIVPSRPDLPLRRDVPLVSARMVQDIFLQMIALPFMMMACFRRGFPDLPYEQIECPSANGDDAFVREHLDQFFRDHYPDEALERIAPRSLRLKAWLLQSDMYERKCEELGIGYVHAPAPSLDTDGYLKPEYHGSDGTHANAAYGRLVLDQLEARVGAPFTGWASFG